MIKNIFTTLLVAFVVSACTPSTNVTENTDAPTNLQTEVVLEQIDVFDQSYVDNSKTYCSGEVSVYTGSGWLISAPDDWQQTSQSIPNADFALVNQAQKLLFTTLSEKTNSTISSYVESKVEALKTSGNTVTTSDVVLGGNNYSLISSPTNNFNNWQWINLTNGTVTVLSCGSPKGTAANYDYCLDLMDLAQRL